jgi:hypothetical protein
MMKTFLLIVLAVSALAGCVIVPAYPDYGYSYGYDRYAYSYPYAYPAYPGYGYRYYRARYYWRQAP